MSTTVTVLNSCPTLRGQDAIVWLSLADSLQMANFSVGQKAQIGSSGTLGHISMLDVQGTYIGNFFKVKPNIDSANLSSTTTPGILAAGDTIIVG